MLEMATTQEQSDQGVEARAERAGQQVGVQPSEVERLPFDLSALNEDGIFINVDAHGFGMLDRRLDWEALGITLPRRTDVAFRPPRCGLLPDRFRLPLLRPTAQAHAALHRYSYTFRLTETVFETPAYRWVPWRAFETFEGAFEQAQEGLEAAKRSVLDQYDVVQAEVVETFQRLADDSARRLEATGQHVPVNFREAVVHEVLNALPSQRDLQEKLSLRYQVGVILLGSEMLAEQHCALEARRKLEEADAAMRLDRERQTARERVVQQEIWAEEERIRCRLQAEGEERRREAAVKERLRQLKLEAAKERLQETLNPLEEGAKQLHAAVYESASAIRASLEKHGHLPGASAKRARELARWFRLMEWQSDAELEALIGELEELARQPRRGIRARAPLDQVLGDIVQLCYADARAVIEPSRMGALEL